MFKITQIFLLVAILAGLAHAQQWKPPTPQEFTVKTAEAEVSVIEEFQETEDRAKTKVFVRGVMVRYLVASSDRQEARMTAFFLGATNEDAARIDAVVYEGVSWAKSPELQYHKVKFYAGDDLVATRQIKRLDDPCNTKAKRIYESARAQHEKEKAGR